MEKQIFCAQIIKAEIHGASIDLWFDNGDRDINCPDATTSLAGLLDLAEDCEVRPRCEQAGFEELWVAWERTHPNFPAISLGEKFSNLSY